MISAGLDIAARWGDALGPEQLQLALKALEPQLKREHEIRMKQLDNLRAQAERAATLEKAAGDRNVRDAERRRNHVYRMSGLVAGVALSLALLGAGVVVAPEQPWLAAGLCGPSLLALVKVFVLRRSDPSDMKAVERAARESAAASAPPPIVP
ncbi:hypothetical protein OG782_18235 [Streptomyces sp. NBC_00876]|uniref:hypothetical protein n=1 Tax=Streptomyces sp. NBC_00876 TaxID=2975853 RepID=UPI00386FD1B9|nr:hypothetical protein OG782_18235 [Streptomyces sp. NBC_00876]